MDKGAGGNRNRRGFRRGPEPPGAAACLVYCRLAVLALLLLWPRPGAGEAAGLSDCPYPPEVCDARGAVFRIAGFDPMASAVRIARDRLLTSRHVVADLEQVEVFLADGTVIAARVLPTDYGGDLVLLKSEELPQGRILAAAGAETGDTLYAVGTDVPSGRIRVYRPGRVLSLPAAGKPLSRLHHSAHSQPGNSGGALVRADGRLVGILASGAEGRFEAIPIEALAGLRSRSGPGYRSASRALGEAVRRCSNLLGAGVGGARSPGGDRDNQLEKQCLRTGNRQFYDLAAQVFGRQRQFARAIDLFDKSLAQDPNADNSRLGLVVTLQAARQYRDAVPHLEILLDAMPDHVQVLWFALQAGAWTGNENLAQRALGRMRLIDPAMAEAANRFYDRAAQQRPPGSN